jgi:aspartyl-tRNA(Asn)/glutamyl-tRNA(Gln) amidotransferase subunit A
VKSIWELAPRIKRGELSPVSLVRETLQRIDRLNPRVNAYITILRDSALKEAESAEKAIREGKYLGPLHGIPIAIKDLIYINGVRITAGSKILATHTATYDAPVIRRLRSAGAVIIGTTNLHEFASGVTSVNPFFGPVRNPWDLTRISGGSSGGSAAAVAADLTVGAMGTDTSGSVRIPAALCGVVGLKPTYGRVSRAGVIPLAASFDTVGTLTSSCWDAAVLLRAISGRDPQDPTPADVEVQDYVSELERPMAASRVGVPRRFFFDIVDPEVSMLFELFLERLTQSGVTTSDSEIREIDKVYDTWAAIRRGEAAAFHDQWFPTMANEYGEDVRRAIEKGREVTAVQYINAQNRRPELKSSFLEAMRQVDFLAVPTTPVPAPLIGEEQVEVAGNKVDVYSILSRLTLPFNVTGFPVVSIPIGLVRGLPVGAQIIGRPFEESAILRLAFNYERKFGFPAPPLN